MALVLGLTVAGSIVAAVLAARDARRDSERRVAIAGAQIRARLDVGTSLTESLSRFMADEGARGVTNAQFTQNALRWLSPAGLPAAAWAEEVPAAGRAKYERRIGGPIVAPGGRGQGAPPGASYLPTTLVSGLPPMSSRGIDLRREPGIDAALRSAIRPGGVGATTIAARPDGTRGLFFVAPAPDVIDGVLRPGAVAVFVSEASLRAAARNPAGLRFPSSGQPAGGDAVREEFTVAGQPFAVVMPKESVTGPGAVLPWIVLAGGLLLAALAGALGVVAARRERAKQDFDRIFNLAPDLVAVASFDGRFRRVNPAAVQLLGYTEEELLSRPYLEFVHPDDRERTAAEAAAVGHGKTTLSFENRFVRKDGAVRVLEWTATPVLEDAVMYGVARDVTARRQAEAQSERLAAEQSALRRVAEAIARQQPPEHVFALVTKELSDLLGVNAVWMARFEPDGTVTVLASRGAADNKMRPGSNVPLPSGTVIERVRDTGRPSRVDRYGVVPGPIGDVLRREGARSGAGGPIVVDGRVWGAMVVGSTTSTLARGTEDRVARFAELVSTAISNVESRARVERLAAEQAALRRVAELVARQAPPEEVFELVTEELHRLLGVTLVSTARFEPDATATVMATRGTAKDMFPPGRNIPLTGGSTIDQVFRTGRAAHVGDYEEVGGEIGRSLRRLGLRWGAAGPIVVDGRLWGAMAIASTSETMPPGTEERVGRFAGLVSTAISNVESRSKVERLAAEQSALRRVATLVARAPGSDRLFSAVAREVASVLNVPGVIVQRYEADGTVVTFGEAFDSELAGAERFFGVGSRMPPDPGSLAAQVLETHGPARLDDFSTLPGTIGELARAAGLGSGCAGPIVVNGALWGKMCVFSRVGTALPVGTENRLHDFIELIATAIANHEAHAGLAASEARARALAEEQAALRRVATLVAEGATPNYVFDAVRDEVEQMFGIPNTILMRFDPEGMATLLATPGDYLGPVGEQWPLEGDDSAVSRVYRTGRAARADYRAGAVGPLADAARLGGTLFPVAVPVVVDGALWGAMSVGSRGPQQPPPDLEGRLAKFTDLLATAIANAESRADLAASESRARGLAEEQAALRRVATLVAREHAPEDLFATLAEEVGVLLDVDAASILRYEPDSTVTVVSGWSGGTISLPLGEQLPLGGDNLSSDVLRTGKPQRKEQYAGAGGRIAATVRELGFRSAVASPIVVEGAIWGVIGVLSVRSEPLPRDTEARLAEFSRVAGMAVANAKNRSDLAQSRARIVRAGDEARRRFERDLHDGAQQRLVSLGLELRAAEASVPPGMADVRGVLSGVATGLTDVLDDLRELSRGLHPAVLSEDGLSPALQSLALRSVVPVDLRIDLNGERFEEPVEVAAYYVASEALTNTAKHAGASQAQVTVAHRDGWLELIVSDDGRGGATTTGGSGLTGLVDRVEAIGGTIRIDSPADAGTAIDVKLPARPGR